MVNRFAAEHHPSNDGARFTSVEQSLDDRIHRWLSGLPQNRATSFLTGLLIFGIKQAWACIFGALLLVAILATQIWYPDDAWLARNDLLTLIAIAIQVTLLATKLETTKELRVVLIFHVVGTGMELFKTQMGSWTYEQEGFLHIGPVPLFTGFMYGAVGSYMVRVYRLFDLRFNRYPRQWVTAVIAAAIYINFFSHHFVWDARWLLLAVVAVAFGPTVMYYRVRERYFRMPLLVAFGLVALFIWIAENAATFGGAWLYPNQADGWSLVSPQKIVSWFLLMIISVSLVTWIYPPKRLKPTR